MRAPARIASIVVTAGVLGSACSTLDGLSGATSEPADAGVAADAEAGPTCPPGFLDCDGNPANGCETNITDNPSHCGFCGNVCPVRPNGYPVCVDAVCRAGCNTGFDNCDGDDANGCERSVSADATNCGACGRDCKGALCSNGTCEPQKLQSALTTPGAIAVAGADMYFEGLVGPKRQIFRAPSTGGVATAVADVAVAVTRMAADASWLVWAGDGLYACALPGCAMPRTVAVAGRTVHDFTLFDTKDVYVATSTATDGAVGRIAKNSLSSDTSISIPFTPVFSGPYAFSIAAGASGMFFGTVDQGSVGTVRAVAMPPAPGSKPATVTPASIVVGGLFVSGDRLFWSRPNELFGCAGSSCTSPKSYGTPPMPVGVAVDDQFVYWTQSGTSAGAFQDGVVLRCPLTGCVGAPTVLARQQHNPHGLCIAQDHVYWTTRGNETPGAGSIVRVAR